jgi:ubiquinone/menaquinone biosynthesis C-methylase UbiE
MGRRNMKRFWDERAREDAFYFVDNRLDYGSPDEERFWADGEAVLDEVLGAVGARLEPGDRVVEIGCGVGRLTRAIASRCTAVDAVDVSAEMLALAREHNPELGNVRWILGDGETLTGVADESADACFSHVDFQHIPDPAITLGYVREIGRVLRPGGRAVFQISNLPSIHRRESLSSRLSTRARALAGRGPRGQDDPAWRGSSVDLDELRTTAEAAGMEVVETAGAGTQFCIVHLGKRGDRG